MKLYNHYKSGKSVSKQSKQCVSTASQKRKLKWLKRKSITLCCYKHDKLCAGPSVIVYMLASVGLHVCVCVSWSLQHTLCRVTRLYIEVKGYNLAGSQLSHREDTPVTFDKE